MVMGNLATRNSTLPLQWHEVTYCFPFSAASFLEVITSLALSTNVNVFALRLPTASLVLSTTSVCVSDVSPRAKDVSEVSGLLTNNHFPSTLRKRDFSVRVMRSDVSSAVLVTPSRVPLNLAKNLYQIRKVTYASSAVSPGSSFKITHCKHQSKGLPYSCECQCTSVITS